MITIDDHDVELKWMNVRKDKVRKEWNKYCFVLRSKSGGFIEVRVLTYLLVAIQL